MNDLQLQTFEPHIGSRFSLQAGDAPVVELELIEASDLETRDPHRDERLRRVPFALVFRAAGDPGLPQQIFKLNHETLGELDIFLVPIGPDRESGGMCYEAVFN